MSTAANEPTYDLNTSTHIAAPPAEVYEIASDITRMGEWSPECTGGEWTRGDPGTVGASFQGHNRRGEHTWTAECEVVSAEPGRRFAWRVLTPADDAAECVWSFDIDPDGDGALLTQRFVLRGVPEGMRRIRESLSAKEAETFLEDRERGLRDGMRQTIGGIKATAEG